MPGAKAALDDDAELPPRLVPRNCAPLVTPSRTCLRVQHDRARAPLHRRCGARAQDPLTAVKTHLQVLRLALARKQGCPRGEGGANAADDGVLRMQRTLEKSALLARPDGGDEVDPNLCADAADAARQAVAEVSPGARRGRSR